VIIKPQCSKSQGYPVSGVWQTFKKKPRIYLSRHMDTVRIIGTGSYVPPTILTNFDLQKMGLDTTDDWIVQRTGIRERRIADPEGVQKPHPFHIRAWYFLP